MRITDELKHHDKFTSIAMTDFIEALCRLASFKSWPNDHMLEMGWPRADVLQFFDEIEDYNDDEDKAHLIAPPPEWGEYLGYDLASSSVKMLLVLYRRIEKAYHSDAKMRTKITKPGQEKCLNYLGLGLKPWEEGYVESPSVASGATSSKGASGRESPNAFSKG
jgi:hypothetical protein